jgi:hypothetical protein
MTCRQIRRQYYKKKRSRAIQKEEEEEEKERRWGSRNKTGKTQHFVVAS